MARAATTVVSLKPKPAKPDGPTEHYIKLSRGADGIGFYVGYVDGTGVEDWRSQSEHRTYDEALKHAQTRAHDVRRPIKDVTGIEPQTEEKPSAPAISQMKAQGTKASGDWATYKKRANADDGPDIDELFQLPDIGPRLEALDLEALGKKSDSEFRETRSECALAQDEIYGDTRNHPIEYSQRTHDIVQRQIAQAYHRTTATELKLLTILELAFERIEALEHAPKGMTYRGVFTPSETYAPQDVVTWGGSMWTAKEATNARPDEAHHAWQLCVRKGRDGKDNRDRKES